MSKSTATVLLALRCWDKVELDLLKGEKTSLVGRSGTGKSTLLSVIVGLMRPDKGHVYIGGQQMDQLDDNDRANLRADRIGFVLQSDNLIPFLTAVENVELAMGFASARRPAARARELLSELGFGHRMDHLPWQLSGGDYSGWRERWPMNGPAPRRRGCRSTRSNTASYVRHDLYGLEGTQSHSPVRHP